jgi:hypothetical protein
MHSCFLTIPGAQSSQSAVRTLRHCSRALPTSQRRAGRRRCGWSLPPSVGLPWEPKRESVSHEMHPAPLPRGAHQDCLDGPLQASVLQASVGVALWSPESHPREPSGDQRAHKRCPECLILAGDHLEAQDLSLRSLPSRRWRSPPPPRPPYRRVAGLDVSGVEPHVGVGAFQRSASEALDLLVQLLAESADPALLMPPIPRAFISSSTLRVETPWT